MNREEAEEVLKKSGYCVVHKKLKTYSTFSNRPFCMECAKEQDMLWKREIAEAKAVLGWNL